MLPGMNRTVLHSLYAGRSLILSSLNRLYTGSTRPLANLVNTGQPTDGNSLDIFIQQHAERLIQDDDSGSLRSKLYDQYKSYDGNVMSDVLPYEAYPKGNRRADFVPTQTQIDGVDEQEIGDGLVLVVHAVSDGRGSDIQYILCSGFAVRTESGKKYIATCAHTFEEVNYERTQKTQASFIIVPQRSGPSYIMHITDIPSSSSRSDLIICSSDSPILSRLRTLPVTPFPSYRGNEVLVHNFGSPGPPDSVISPLVEERQGKMMKLSERKDEAVPWPAGLGYRRWVSGHMLGYRNSSWREVEPGTSSNLPYLLVSPLPSPGSSGGPILDTKSGSVIGIISGRRMDSRVEGERGWGSSSESLYELFTMPGFKPASSNR